MAVENIKSFKFTYTPWDTNYPIRTCELTIYAKDRTEAEMIALKEGWKFFEQNVTVSVEESKIVGYRRIK